MAALFATLTAESLLRAALAYLGFVGVLFALSIVMPGKRELGAAIPSGKRVEYTLNGFRIFLSVVALCALGAGLGWLDLSFPVRHFLPLLIVANTFAFAWTFILYAWGRSKGIGGRDGGSGGWLQAIKDMFYGVDLNPAIFGVDLKLFSYRPSLIGLGILNVSFAFVQLREQGQISAPMALYQVFCFLYLANYFQFEYGMIYTWDIIAERFGWMLVWGDYVLVPFFYSMPGWYLVTRTEPIPPWQIALLCATYVTGFVLFRGSNEQKHRYKQDPSCRIWGKPAEALGGKLLVSGFWGIGRKLNYTGEIMMYYSWTLTTGTQSIAPYLLPLWLTVLLPHRAFRDEERCRAKYGELWEAYCRRAKFRMVPFIYLIVRSREMSSTNTTTPSSGRTLLTGASGHLGANLLRRLLDDGHQVRVLLRQGSDNSAIDGLDVERVWGDLRDSQAVDAAVKGCRLVYHPAAKLSTIYGDHAHKREIYDSNVTGTRHLLESCLRHGVEKAVVTGSFSATGYDAKDPSRPSDEEMRYYPFEHVMPYEFSKTFVEFEVLKAVSRGLHACIATSCAIIGPHDYKPSRMGRTLCDFANGKLRAYIEGGFSFVAARDIVEGHVLAMERGRKGEKYIFATEFMMLSQIMDIWEETTGRSKPRLKLPPAVMLAFAEVMSPILTRLAPNFPQRLTPGAIRILRLCRHADTSKAKRELGFVPTTMRAAWEDAYEFFLRRGAIASPNPRRIHSRQDAPQALGQPVETKSSEPAARI